MDADRFDTLTRTLSAPLSRRLTLGRLATGVLLALGLASDETPVLAKKKNKGKDTVTLCHAGQTIRVSKKAKPKHLKHGDTLGACPSSSPPPPPPPSPPPPPTSPVPVLTYQCPGPADFPVSSPYPETVRYAQTFTAGQSGTLHQIQFEINKQVDSVGDYLVELLDFDTDGPTNTVLAAATVPNASVPDGASTLTGSFSGPPLTAGTEYAAALSRPGGSQLEASARDGNDCTGRLFRQNHRGSGPFDEIFSGLDLVTAVTILA